MAYDIIDDIHGQAEKLEALLRTLGYRDTVARGFTPHETAFISVRSVAAPRSPASYPYQQLTGEVDRERRRWTRG